MSDRTAFCVYVDLDGKAVLVGTLSARFRNNRESATFTDDVSWLSHPSRFALERYRAAFPEAQVSRSTGRSFFR